jgi:Bifunctional DNA primase/polymerase, N-terminal
VVGTPRRSYAGGVALTSELITLALSLARNASYAVFPCSANKKPAIPKEEGGNGFLDATTDPDTIRRLFAQPNAALIGVATGAASGISVLDVDAGRYPDDAPQNLADKHQAARLWWHANCDRLPATRIYESASGGLHVYFRHRAGIGSTQSRIHQGVDTRGDGGYIIGWFAAGFACFDHSPPADWPDWLLEALTAPKAMATPPTRTARSRRPAPKVDQLVRRALERIGTAPEGAKHETLRDTARLLGGIQAEVGFSDHEALEWFKGVLPSTVKDWRNIAKTALWGLEHGRTAPLQLRRAD